MALQVEQTCSTDFLGLTSTTQQAISFHTTEFEDRGDVIESYSENVPKTEEGRISPTASEHEELFQDGVLDEEAISSGLSNMGRTSDGTEATFLHLTLPGYSLANIDILASYIYLQKLEVPYNNLTDLSVVSSMPYLVELDASHNELTTLLDFSPPQNLKEVDLSFNKIEEMGDLSAHHALTKLILDKNYLSQISGIESCIALQQLSLAHNNIRKIENVENLSLKYLNLRGNQVEEIDNLASLKYLQQLDLSGNTISSLRGVEENRVLEILDCENNQIANIEEVEHIKGLRLLRCLNLLRNPIQDSADYRMSLLFRLPQLSELDRHRAEAEEKIAAVNLFNPPPEVVAAQDHRKCMVYSTLRSARLYSSTLPSIETPYPILVLSGPPGAGKRTFAHRLLQEYGSYFGIGIIHTTRSPLTGEIEGNGYSFILPDEFDAMLRKGEFLLTYQLTGHSYGVSLNAIEDVAEQGLACILPIEVEGVVTLKLTHFQPRYILLLPLDSNRQEERLQSVGGLSSSQISHAACKTRLYQQIHQDQPGFFDRVIDTSDLEKSYSQLSQLVMTYLGIEPSAPGSNRDYSGHRANSASHSGIQLDGGSLSQTQCQRAGSSVPWTWSKQPGDPVPEQPRPGSQQREGSARRMNSVEKASYERRKNAAQIAAAGIVPKPLEELVDRPPGTAPGESQFDLDPEKPLRPMTVPTSHDFYSASPDSSVPSVASDSHLSNISEAGGIGSPSESPLGNGDDEVLRSTSRTSFACDMQALPPISPLEQDNNDPEY